MSEKPKILSLFVGRKSKSYWLGNFNIKVIAGEIFYHPSQNLSVKRGENISGRGFISKDTDKIKIDHYSFHQTGEMHITKKKSKRGDKHIMIESSKNRISIIDTGQQHLFTDFVKDITKLPNRARPTGDEIIFDIKDNISKVFLRIDLLSGRNLIKNDYKRIPVEDKEGRLLVLERRALGVESGNQDKVLHFSLYEDKREILDFERRIFSPYCENKRRSW
ncbi:MAG: hypothetical protein ABIE14_00335 [Patescibacteria group bacterium]